MMPQPSTRAYAHYGLCAAAIKHIAGHPCEVAHADKQACFTHFPKDRHQWCWPCYARYVMRNGKQ